MRLFQKALTVINYTICCTSQSGSSTEFFFLSKRRNWKKFRYPELATQGNTRFLHHRKQ